MADEDHGASLAEPADGVNATPRVAKMFWIAVSDSAKMQVNCTCGKAQKGRSSVTEMTLRKATELTIQNNISHLAGNLQRNNWLELARIG
jgi:hypothetical protein